MRVFTQVGVSISSRYRFFGILVSFYLRDAVSTVFAMATCLAGWVAVHYMAVLYQNG